MTSAPSTPGLLRVRWLRGFLLTAGAAALVVVAIKGRAAVGAAGVRESTVGYAGVGPLEALALGGAGALFLLGAALFLPAVQRAAARWVTPQLLALGLGLLLAASVGEGGARIYERLAFAHLEHAARTPWAMPLAPFGRTVVDARLGVRMAPKSHGHDARGFRNAEALAAADVVAIGDSQTWGINARTDEAWPAVLEALIGRRVYSMALGAYGPLEYFALTAEARALRPAVVLIGVYLGNDIISAWQRVARPGLDPALRRAVAPETARDLDPGWLVPGAVPDPSADPVFLDDQREIERGQSAPLGTLGVVALLQRSFVVHAAVGRLLFRSGLLSGGLDWRSLRVRSARRWARTHPARGFVVEGPQATVMTPALRLSALDQDHAAGRAGLALSIHLLRKTAAHLATWPAGLVVVLIPTKERVYARADPNGPWRDHAVYRRLVQQERQVAARIAAALRPMDVAIVDVTGALAAALGGSARVYPPDDDGHPEAAGYRAIARAIAEAVFGNEAGPRSGRTAPFAGRAAWPAGDR